MKREATMTAAAARVSSRADAAASDAANDARGEVTKIPGVSKAIAAKAVKNGYYHFIVDIWITNLNCTEFGIYKHSRNRAKSRQFTSDMDIFAEVIENGERTGLSATARTSGRRTEAWTSAWCSSCSMRSLNWRATMDLMIGRILQQTLAARGLPVTAFSVNADEDDYMVYLERSANKWPLLPENFSFFLLERRQAAVLPAQARPHRSRRRLHALQPPQPERRPSRRQGVLDRRQVEGQGARRARRPAPADRAASCSAACRSSTPTAAATCERLWKDVGSGKFKPALDKQEADLYKNPRRVR